MLDRFNQYDIILASQSPRRQQILSDLGLKFRVLTKDGIEENYPHTLENEEIAIFLSELKAKAFEAELADNSLLITADTIVLLTEEVLGKPKDAEEAKRMLRSLSGTAHQVITGVCISSKTKKLSFATTTDVFFKEITDEEIAYYVEKYKPFDKAGAYGIQEWIGFIGVERIEGSYFNVMGLPVQQLYEKLCLFIDS